MVEVRFEQISPADFFYRNRDIAGFSNPSRSLYMSIRELVENSLDACEAGRIPPDVLIDLRAQANESEGDVKVYRLTVKDNGIGVESDYIPKAFGTILFGSKYGFKQSRGTFGVGGTMALLYGQITTNNPFRVISSTGKKEIHEYSMMIDIVENKPKIIEHKKHPNQNGWRGTIIDYTLEADYTNSRSKIIEYLINTSIINPHANLTFIDPRGRVYSFMRVIDEIPVPPKEARPHPLGVDVETMNRLLASTKARDVTTFLIREFQKVGRVTALEVLKLTDIDPKQRPKDLSHDQVTMLVDAIKRYGKFRAPDPSSLSPVGKEFLEKGIRSILEPEFINVVQRPPSSYSGIPFIVEVAVAYGGKIPISDEIHLYRFANKIPLLYDERADVSWKVINERIDWSSYKVMKEAPLAIFTSICSPKVPYKTVGKEAIADRPEIERELVIAVREAARHLRGYLTQIEKGEEVKKRLNVYAKYLPKVVKLSSELAGTNPPDITPLLKRVGVTKAMIKEVEEQEAKESEEILIGGEE
ncbi:MAG: DNA topoisomerase VI subunit B [Aigarchaeota archaeon]|nr:DNA topoisomerase VI subunit B [Aigarchaeota archaeon]MDW8093128.1 DNA topoisomerase VI subunit B [Nitrososphaerota archaeon]